MFNAPSPSHVHRTEDCDMWGYYRLSTMHQDATSPRHPGYLEKQDEKTTQILLEGSIHILTNFQSFQRHFKNHRRARSIYTLFSAYITSLVIDTLS